MRGHELYGTNDKWTDEFKEFLRNNPCRDCLEDRESIHWELGRPGRYGYEDMRRCGGGIVKTQAAALAKAHRAYSEHTSWRSGEEQSLVLLEQDRTFGYESSSKPTVWEHLDLAIWDETDTIETATAREAAESFDKSRKKERNSRWVRDYDYFFCLGEPDGNGQIVWEDWVPLAIAWHRPV